MVRIRIIIIIIILFARNDIPVPTHLSGDSTLQRRVSCKHFHLRSVVVIPDIIIFIVIIVVIIIIIIIIASSQRIFYERPHCHLVTPYGGKWIYLNLNGMGWRRQVGYHGQEVPGTFLVLPKKSIPRPDPKN